MKKQSLIRSILRLIFPHKLLQKMSVARYKDLRELSNDELLSSMRHESHRIEKAVYNKALKSKESIYLKKREKIGRIHQILKERGYPTSDPTVVWSKQIYDNFNNLQEELTKRKSFSSPDFDLTVAEEFIEFLRSRRSVRVWAEVQPEEDTLLQLAKKMIDAARWAPNSGNRQTWRFRIITKREEKVLLKGIKEFHCTSAPLLIFVGIDNRLYGALGNSERSIFIDAGVAIMQMILLAHKCGFSTCWNHLADDLINSRWSNKEIYLKLTKELGIPPFITPIAVLAVGVAKFIPLIPSRMEIESLMIKSK